jgi:hypothetical protein
MQAIPLAFFLFLVGLAAGGILVSALLDWDGEVSKGFLFLNGAFLLVFGAAGIWLRSVLPAARLLDYPAGDPWVRWEVGAWAMFAVLTAVQLFFLKTEREPASRYAGIAAGASALGALAVSAAAYANPQVSTPLLLANQLIAALALGTVWSGMMLGHWYLVTPRLAPRPLLRLNAGMVAALLLQGGLVAWMATTRTIAPDVVWLLWLRVGVGILFPLALAFPIWRTARVRSMMSATGLLYVALGTVLSGEIIAKALYFITGVPM